MVMAGGAREDTVIKRLASSLVDSWSKRFDLTFSEKKCVAMTLKGGRKPNHSIPFGTSTTQPSIKAVGCVKYLGVNIDPQWSFWPHIKALESKNVAMFQGLNP